MSEAGPEECLSAYIAHDENVTKAARSLGIPRTTFRERMERAGGDAERGQSDDPPQNRSSVNYEEGTGWIEFRGDSFPDPQELLKREGLDPLEWKVIEVSPNHWQGFYKTGEKGNEDHKKVDLYQVKIRIKRIARSHIIEAARELAARQKPLPVPKPRTRKTPKGPPQMLVFGLYDVHIGALAWEAECGENNNTNLGVERCKNAVDDLMREVAPYNIERAVVPVGNDIAHFDNFKIETSSGNHTMDSDSRYPKIVVACHDVLAYQIDSLLADVEQVTVKLVQGNHDRDTAFHLCCWLEQRYRNDERVVVDIDLMSRKYVFWKGTLLGFMHGDKAKKERGFRLMAEEAKGHWGEAKCKEIHTGHFHNRDTTEQKVEGSIGKVTIRQNPSLAPPDFWTTTMGYQSVRCADAYRYDPDHGFVGMHTCYARTGR